MKLIREHALLLSLVILLLVAVPGQWRIEQAVNQAERLVAEVAEVQDQLAIEAELRADLVCEATVTARNDTRFMWVYAIQDNADNPDASLYEDVLNQFVPALECNEFHIAVPVE